LGFALVGVIWVEGIIDSPLDTRRPAEEAVALSNEHGFPAWLALGLVYHGWSLAALGHMPEGLALMSKGLSAYRSFGLLGGKPSALRMVAETYLKAGRLDESMKFVAEAFQIISDTDERRSEAELHRLQGDLLNAAGDQAAAAQSYRQALIVAQRQSARLFELQAATNLARLWRDQSKREQACALLAPIYSWFTEGFNTPVLGEASAMLEQLGSPNRYSA
jgi:predicted ATPase